MSMAGDKKGRVFEDCKDGVLIYLKGVPRSSRTELHKSNEGLRIRIAAPPVDGAANAEIIRFLAKTLGVSKSAVEIVGGHRGKYKRVLVREMKADRAREILEAVAK